jgi:hypothetical protein
MNDDVMAPENEIPASALLHMALDLLAGEFQRSVQTAVSAERDGRGIPTDMQFDLTRRMWVRPPADVAG